MLSYDDCLGFCELTPEEIAAIARHEHLPEIVALELGAHLCTTLEGKGAIRRMILDDIEDARERGDMSAAASLELVLQHFVETRLDRPWPAQLDQPTDRVEEVAMPDATPAHYTLEQRIHALGFDATVAPWVRRRVEAYLAAMVRHYGLDFPRLRDRFPLELLAAETRCAACQETRRCRRFLAGVPTGDAPHAFRSNASLFRELQRRNQPVGSQATV
jgi:hypothetical protein